MKLLLETFAVYCNLGPDCGVGNTEKYLNFLDVNLSSHFYRALMLDDLNEFNYIWSNGTFSNTSYYNKINGKVIHVTSYFLVSVSKTVFQIMHSSILSLQYSTI